jgi:signal transduction histidine kinase
VIDRLIIPEDSLSGLPDVVNRGLEQHDLIGECLKFLLRMGFGRARYYEIDRHEPNRKEICVLLRQESRDGTISENRGYTILWTDTALSRAGGGTRVAVATDSFPDRTDWQRDLGLLGRESVDFPVTTDGEVVGLLAADAEPGLLRLTLQGERTLLAVGAIAGSATRTSLAGIDTVALKRDHTVTTPEAYALEAARELLQVIDGEICAVFGFDWRNNQLAKRGEFTGPGVHRGTETSYLPERYNVGDSLTGRAWGRPDLRYIPDFSLFRADAPDVINPESLSYHESLLGHPLKSVIYGIVGRSEPRYLIRIFNRRLEPEVPFLTLHDRFRAAEAILSVGFDDLVAKRRLHFVGTTARSGITNVTRPELVVQSGKAALADEGIADFMLICQSPASRRPAFVYAEGQFNHLTAKLWEIDISVDVDLKDTVARPSEVITLSSLRRALPDLAEILIEDQPGIAETGLFSCFSSEAGQTRCLLLADAGRGSRRRRGGSEAGESSVAAVQTLLDLFVEAVDSKYEHLTARGARHALGYVGHELGTPLTMLGDAAVAAVDAALETIDQSQGIDPIQAAAARVRLKRLYARVQDGRGATQSAFRLAPLVVQIGEGSLPMYFTRESLKVLVDEANNQITSSTRSRQQRDSGAKVRDLSRQFRVSVNESVNAGGSISCDRYLIRQVLVNLLDNAVKYSLPRWPSREEPMEITVSASSPTPTELSLLVQNWGLGVEAENAETIFEPFVRGEQEDRLKAIRGMGIGLYLSRLIAQAHGGSLHLRGSQSTKGDQRSADRQNEGFLTTFELRLPRLQMDGPFRFVWGGRRGHLLEGS